MSDFSQRLKQFLFTVKLTSFRQLEIKANVSRHTICQLRDGHAEKISYQELHRMAMVLNCSVTDLVSVFASDLIYSDDSATVTDSAPSPVTSLAKSISPSGGTAPLSKQQQESITIAKLELQREALQVLETLLIQLPTAIHAAEQNPTLPAKNILPLLRPINTLMHRWQVTAIGTVGQSIPFDPRRHTLIEGTADPGQPVTVRYVGYEQRGKIFYRAKVSSTNSGNQ
ncbi:MAG: helix-turn-helix domain-containing protein [Pseudanabaenaceae cyanobacterium]|jgi:DNA-binding Xre family transcriptional regulator